MKIEYVRDGEKLTTTINAIRAGDNTYKIGLWVRDAAAGVGTASFYEPNTGKFAALGHGIIDIDTEKLIDIASGEVVTANILSVEKGVNGSPGKIQGTIDGEHTIGSIYKNTQYGIYGNIKDIGYLTIDKNNVYKIALKNEIKIGDAKLISTLENRQNKRI